MEKPPGSSFRVEIPDDVAEELGNIAHKIIEMLPKGWGFGLFLFTFGKDGTMTWISNARREDMIQALQEFIKVEAS